MQTQERILSRIKAEGNFRVNFTSLFLFLTAHGDLHPGQGNDHDAG